MENLNWESNNSKHHKAHLDGTELGNEIGDRESADATLRICSRLFLSLSVIGGLICFILIASKGGGSQLILAFLYATGIICMGFIIWAACNVLVNISSNIREIAKSKGGNH